MHQKAVAFVAVYTKHLTGFPIFRASLIVYVDSSDAEFFSKDAESGNCWSNYNCVVLFYSDTRGSSERDWFVSDHRVVRLCLVACVSVLHFLSAYAYLRYRSLPEDK